MFFKRWEKYKFIYNWRFFFLNFSSQLYILFSQPVVKSEKLPSDLSQTKLNDDMYWSLSWEMLF